MYQNITAIFNSKTKPNIRLIATDMDGTLTKKEKFTPDLLQALESLAQANIPVLIVTGRSAGWVDAVYHYLPITGAIAENGGLFYYQNHQNPIILTPLARAIPKGIRDLNQHRKKLSDTFNNLKKKFPQLQEAADNYFRFSDWTFDIKGLTDTQLIELKNMCQQENWSFTYSTVQCHIKPPNQDKANSLLQVLYQYFPDIRKEEIITIGDSPNDESLFNQQYFPLSVGVANILDYDQQLKYRPTYLTTKTESVGFCELIKLILAVKTTPSLTLS